MLAEFRVHGLDCAEEVAILRKELEPVAGITALRFDVALGKLSIEYEADRVSPADFRRIVGRTGMSLDDWASAAGPAPASYASWVPLAICGLALVCGTAVQADSPEEFVTAFIAHGAHGHDHEEAAKPLAIGFYLIAMFTGAWRVAPKALAALRMRRAETNLLVLLSLGGAAFLGEWTEGATLAFLFTLAGLLEGWSIRRAQGELAALGAAEVSCACVVHRHGDHEHEHTTPLDSVRRGDRIRVRPGERIPCDGEVVSGSSAVDESVVTGEPVPLEKAPGSQVTSGSINGYGLLEIRVSAEPQDHTAVRMERLVTDAAAHRRAKSEQFVERMSRYYTPAVLLLAAAVLLWGLIADPGGEFAEHMHRAMLVLLVACPCALVISTPVTIAAALASAAREGVIIKGGAALEEAGRLNAIVFDKTGVLTTGNPEVCEFRPLNGLAADAVVRRLARMENGSAHPIAKAVVRYGRGHALEDEPTLPRVRTLPGMGIEAESPVDILWAGNTRLLKHHAGSNVAAVDAALAEMESAQHTAFVCGAGREVWAVVGLEDPLREDARATIDALRAMRPSAELVLLTGDGAGAAAKVRTQLGLDQAISDLLPGDKREKILGLLAKHRSVAMIGDGQNDAPAMASASLGIAMGASGGGAVAEAADVILTKGQLGSMPYLIRHASRATWIIRQNVAIALGFKALFLVAAFYGSATLWMAVAADMGATILVIFNGLRMLRSAPPR